MAVAVCLDAANSKAADLAPDYAPCLEHPTQFLVWRGMMDCGGVYPVMGQPAQGAAANLEALKLLATSKAQVAPQTADTPVP